MIVDFKNELKLLKQFISKPFDFILKEYQLALIDCKNKRNIKTALIFSAKLLKYHHCPVGRDMQ